MKFHCIHVIQDDVVLLNQQYIIDYDSKCHREHFEK